MKYSELRAEVRSLENEARRLEDEIRQLRHRHAREVEQLQHRIDALMDPFIRAKMLEPAPTIHLHATPAVIAALVRPMLADPAPPSRDAEQAQGTAPHEPPGDSKRG